MERNGERMRQKRIYKKMQYHGTLKSCNLLLISSLLQCKQAMQFLFQEEDKIILRKILFVLCKDTENKKGRRSAFDDD